MYIPGFLTLEPSYTQRTPHRNSCCISSVVSFVSNTTTNTYIYRALKLSNPAQ